MKTVPITLTLSALAVASTAWMPNPSGQTHKLGTGSSFHASVNGAVSTEISGDARFGAVSGTAGAPATFTVSLGAYGEHGSILFTSWAPKRLEAGLYRVSDLMDEAAVQALVVTGSTEHPTGSFRVHAGTLTIIKSSDNRIDGIYDLQAEGFTADAPEQEGRTIHVTGSFTALAQ